MKIVITGATGLIGKKLVHALLKNKHEVIALARSPEKLPELPFKNIVKWSDDETPSSQIFENCDVVINLAGEGIAEKRWTEKRKSQIYNSRINATKNIVKTFERLSAETRPKVFISGSAIGYYSQTSGPQNESSECGQGFLANLCEDWERAALPAKDLGIRTVILRTGLVLAREGGVLSKTGPVVLGSGEQWMSWIHIDDMVRFILYAIEKEELSGPYNMTTPHPVKNAEFTKVAADLMGIPFTIKAPAFALRAALGELSETVLSNQNILPSRALDFGFTFEYPNIKVCLNDLLRDFSFLDSTLLSRQFVPLDRKEVFDFFCKAENLETLTPPWLNFKIQKKSTPEVEKGTLIDYKLKIHGVPAKWKTLIFDWRPDTSFVDLQLKGPYKKWHHLHEFESVLGGTLISDSVTFRIPGGIAGKLLLPLIKRDVNAIFKYRQKKIDELFSQTQNGNTDRFGLS